MSAHQTVPSLPIIRPATATDRGAMLGIAEASGLFPPDEIGEVEQLLAEHFSGKLGSDHTWIVGTRDSVPVAVAYYAPERMTSGTWNLYLIAVRPEHQGKGHGTALVGHVERALVARGARLLLVETAGLESFALTRAFYRKCRFDEEARIRDFYDAGVDKMVFRKVLA